MGKMKKAVRVAKRVGLGMMALEGLQAMALAGAARYVGTRLRERGRRPITRGAGKALLTAAALVPAARMVRRMA